MTIQWGHSVRTMGLEAVVMEEVVVVGLVEDLVEGTVVILTGALFRCTSRVHPAMWYVLGDPNSVLPTLFLRSAQFFTHMGTPLLKYNL